MMHHTSMWGVPDPADSPRDLAVVPDEEMDERTGSSDLVGSLSLLNGGRDDDSQIGRVSASFEGPPVSRPLDFGAAGVRATQDSEARVHFVDPLYDALIAHFQCIGSTFLNLLEIRSPLAHENLFGFSANEVSNFFQRFEACFFNALETLEASAAAVPVEEVEEVEVDSGEEEGDLTALGQEILYLHLEMRRLRSQFSTLQEQRLIGRNLLQLEEVSRNQDDPPMRPPPTEPQMKPWSEIVPVPVLDSSRDLQQPARGRERNSGQSRSLLPTAPMDRMFDDVFTPTSDIFDAFEAEIESEGMS